MALWGTTISCKHCTLVGGCAPSLGYEGIGRPFGRTLRRWQEHAFRRLAFPILGLPPSRLLLCCGRCGLLGKGLSSCRSLVDCAWNGSDALVRILTGHSLAKSVIDVSCWRCGGSKNEQGLRSRLLHSLRGARVHIWRTKASVGELPSFGS